MLARGGSCHRQGVLSMCLMFVLSFVGLSMTAPQSAVAVGQPIGLFTSCWLEDGALWVLRNLDDVAITGTLQLDQGPQSRYVTIPAGYSQAFVFDGGDFQSATFTPDDPSIPSTATYQVKHYCGAHIQVDLDWQDAPAPDPALFPDYRVIAESDFEVHTYRWTGFTLELLSEVRKPGAPTDREFYDGRIDGRIGVAISVRHENLPPDWMPITTALVVPTPPPVGDSAVRDAWAQAYLRPEAGNNPSYKFGTQEAVLRYQQPVEPGTSVPPTPSTNPAATSTSEAATTTLFVPQTTQPGPITQPIVTDTLPETGPADAGSMSVAAVVALAVGMTLLAVARLRLRTFPTS